MNTTIDKESVFCPMCYQIPEKEIYQCLSGHVFCGKCSAKIEACPQCQESFRGKERTRNRFMEWTLDDIEFDCPFTDEGCEVKKIKRDKLAIHRSSCKFRKIVPLCELLELSGNGEQGTCNYKVDMGMGNLNEVSTHLATAHKKTRLIEKDGKIVADFKKFFKPGNRAYIRVLKFDALKDNIIFAAKQEDDFVSWIFLDLSENQYKLNRPQMHIKLWSDETPEVLWTDPVFPVLEAEEHFNGSVVKTSIPALKTMFPQRKKTCFPCFKGIREDDCVINLKLIA